MQDGTYYLIGTSQKVAVPVKKTDPTSAKVYLSRTINIYKSSTLCDWQLISGSGAFNRSTLEVQMPKVSANWTVRMERPKLARASTGQYVMWIHAQDGQNPRNSNVAVVYSDTIAGPYTWHASFFADGQVSKDSTVFTDIDGQSYFVRDTNHACDAFSPLAADGFGTTGICSTTGDPAVTGNCTKLAPEGPQGADWLCEGVAVFRDPVDSRLFLLGSHLTGWAANAAMLFVGDRGEVCGSRWTYLGNPAAGPGADGTFKAQSTFVLPFRDRCNQTTLVMMADIWNSPNESLATYAWLPFERSAAGNWTFRWADEWSLPQCRGGGQEAHSGISVV